MGGITADDEFIELYNPTALDTSMEGWRLSIKSSAGTSTSNLLTTFPNVTIKSHGYFLIAPTEYDGPTLEDVNYSTSAHIGANNTVVLYSDSGATTVDLVGMGTAVIKEGDNAPLPANDSSIERVLGIDTDNNFADFHIKTPSDPQNSGFIEETPTPTAIPTQTPTPSSSPTEEPSPTPTPTVTPSEEPTPSPTLSPTPIASPKPTAEAGTPPGWLKSPVFTCQNPHVPSFVYTLLKLLMPWKFHCPNS